MNKLTVGACIEHLERPWLLTLPARSSEYSQTASGNKRERRGCNLMTVSME